MNRKTVLVVDDDPDLLKLLALRLGAAGYAVHAAESGEKALAVLAVSRPDVVVTDLKMGGMDGLALFEAIQKTAPALPVIILTRTGRSPMRWMRPGGGYSVSCRSRSRARSCSRRSSRR